MTPSGTFYLRRRALLPPTRVKKLQDNRLENMTAAQSSKKILIHITEHLRDHKYTDVYIT